MTSTTLNSATNAQLLNVETITAIGASVGVSVSLASQSEGFTIKGSLYADRLTGAAGADSINAGVGDDTINGFAGADTVDGGDATTIVQDPVVTGTWRSVDIPMAQFGASLNKSKITQILLDPQLGGSTVYVDNFYFYRPASSLPSPTITNFNVPNKVVGNAPFTLTAPTSNSAGAFTYTSSNTAVATVS